MSDSVFILTKHSKGGVRYYFTGALNLTSDQKGCTFATAQTGLLRDDAYHFANATAALQWAEVLNRYGIGGAPWTVERYETDDDVILVRPATPFEPGVPIPPANTQDREAQIAAEGARDD